MNVVRPAVEPSSTVTPEGVRDNFAGDDDISSDEPTDPEMRLTPHQKQQKREMKQKGGVGNPKCQKWHAMVILCLFVVVGIILSSIGGAGNTVVTTSGVVIDHCISSLNSNTGCSSVERCENELESFKCIQCPTNHISSPDGADCVLDCPEGFAPSGDGDTCILDVCGPSAHLMGEARINDISEGGAGILHSIRKNGYFGSSSISLGNWDGSGGVDIAVGSKNRWGGADESMPAGYDGGGGEVHILLLGPDHSPQFERTIQRDRVSNAPLNNLDHFGNSLASPGDLDGDGVRDIIVGAPGDDDGGENLGAVYVLWLEASAKVKREQKISSTQGGGGVLLLRENDFFGRAMAMVGDDNNEEEVNPGVVDLVVGSLRAVYRVLLNRDDGTVQSRKLLKKSNNKEGGGQGPWWRVYTTRLGGVAGVGDVNGDGVVDIAIGEPGDYENSTGGAVFVLFMLKDGSIQREQRISGTEGGLVGPLSEGDRFGESGGVTSLGDLDGDGTPDIAVGASGTPKDVGVGGHMGAVYILLLTPKGTVKAEQLIGGNNRGGLSESLSLRDSFGVSVARLVEEEEEEASGGGVVTLLVGTEDSRIQQNGGGVYILQLPPSYVEVCGDGKACVNTYLEEEGDGGPSYTCE